MINKGFTIIELMVVVAIIAFLAMISVPSFTRFLAKSKRAEAYMNLHALYAAQKSYWTEHGSYTQILNGPNSAGWSPEGYHGGGESENFYYTYGLGNGSEGNSHFTGKLGTSASHLSKGYANKDGFLLLAAGDILNNGTPDILAIDQNNNITILQDALAG
jgi:type IV pilus assembly protein PilA